MEHATWDEAATNWLEFVTFRRRLSPRTVATYASILRATGRPLPDHFDGTELSAVLDLRLGPKATPAVRYNTFVTLKQFFRWWEANGGPPNPLADMQRIRHPTARRRGFTTAELALLEARLVDAPARDRAIVLLLVFNGFRVSDVSGLRVPDIDFAGRRIRVTDGKGALDTWLGLGRPAAAALEKHISGRVRGLVFPSPRSATGRLTNEGIRVIFKRVGGEDLQHLCPHQGRHYFATRLLRSGADANLVRKMMRHSSLTVTQAYVDDDPDLELAALDRLTETAAAPASRDPFAALIEGMVPHLDKPIEVTTPAGIIEGWAAFAAWLEVYLEERPEERTAPRPWPFMYESPEGDVVRVEGHTLGMMLDLARMALPHSVAGPR
jgi:integrase